MAPGFRRDGVWTPVFGELSRAVSTGVTTFYDSINTILTKDEALIKLKKLESIARYSRAIMDDARRQIEGGD